MIKYKKVNSKLKNKKMKEQKKKPETEKKKSVDEKKKTEDKKSESFKPVLITILLVVPLAIITGLIINWLGNTTDDSDTSTSKKGNVVTTYPVIETVIVSDTAYPSTPQWRKPRGLKFDYDTDDYLRIKDANGNEYNIGPDIPQNEDVPGGEQNRIWFLKLRKIPNGGIGHLYVSNIRSNNGDRQGVNYSSAVK